MKRKFPFAVRKRAKLATTSGRLKALEEEIIERLARVEENLRLLRVELVGNGRPGRIGQLETQVDELRAAHQRHRGVFLAVSFVISAAITLLSQLLLP